MSITINKFLQPSTPQYESPTIYNWTDYYPTDVIKNDAGAYALRLLSREYKGSCMRVRRSTDNSESDIGFNSFGTLNTATLTTFCTGGQGFVRTWYDQSGYGNHAIQPVFSNQPRIINSGVIDDGLYFNAVNSNYFRIVNNNIMNLTSAPFSICFVSKLVTNANSQYIYSKNLTQAADIQYGVLFDGTYVSYINGSPRVYSTTIDINKHIYLTTYDGITNKLFIDNIEKAPTAYSSTPLSNSPNIQIGCRSNSVDGSAKIYFLNGNLNELFIYPTNIESNSNTIYLNAKKFHSIP